MSFELYINPIVVFIFTALLLTFNTPNSPLCICLHLGNSLLVFNHSPAVLLYRIVPYKASTLVKFKCAYCGSVRREENIHGIGHYIFPFVIYAVNLLVHAHPIFVRGRASILHIVPEFVSISYQ